MSAQQRQAASKRTTEKEEAPAPAAKSGAQERGEKLRAALDDLIDEIDETLEENAEEF
ncbi:MAG: ubiquitin-like protein Pup, partial [Actinobacteria bacterium]|nr:ubiquitin-like protein Pup [Actinomycetota bacterium]